MTYANIELKEHDKFGEGKKLSIIDPFMKEFVEKLALKYPLWIFAEANMTANHSTKNYEAYRFKVIDKREVIGELDKDWHRDGFKYCIVNHRINDMRERGRGMKTIHLDKAIKHVAKYFGKKTITEQLAEAQEKTRSSLSSVVREREFDLSSSWNKLESHLMRFVGANYEAFILSMVEEDKAKLTHAIEVLPIRLEAMSVANKLKEKFNSRETYIVFINGVDYCIQKGDTSLEIKSSEELPDFVRRAVGLLKLVEDGTLIPNAGIRVNDSTFLVAPNNVSQGEEI
jgi:hypothetical protein